MPEMNAPNVVYYRVSGLLPCRVAAGLTQRELADAVGTHQTDIRGLESSRGLAPRSAFWSLCDALHVYPEDLVFAGKAEDEALLQGRKWRPDVTADQTRSRRHEQVERIKARGFYGDRPGTVCLRGLKACRLAASLSQRELAGRIGMSPGTIVQLEKIQHEKWRRRRGAYMKTVKKLCRALDVSPADLICGPEAEGEDTV